MSYACPKCGSLDLRIEVTVIRELVSPSSGAPYVHPIDDDLEQGSWDDASLVKCEGCDHSTYLPDFRVATLWERLNELSHTYPYDSEQARLLGTAATFLRNLAPNETGGADAAPPRKR